MQLHDQIGLGGVLQRTVRHPFGLHQVTDAVEGVGEPAGQPAVLGRAGRGTGLRPGEELGRDPGRLADQQLGLAGQPAQHPLVHRLGRSAEPAGRPQHLPGHPVGRRARLRQGVRRVAVPGSAQRRGHIVVQGRPDQRVPEPEAVAGLGQHASGACLVHRRDQVRHAAAEHDRQIGDREVRAEQGRRPQHITHGPGHEAEAVRYGRGQRAWRGTARQLGRSRLGDGQPGAAGQRGDQFGDVERVPRGPVGEPHQAVVGPAAGQGRYQVGHRVAGEPGELEPGSLACHPPQRQQVIALRHRAHHPDQQQRYPLRRLGQPSPQGDAGLVGPLQVIHDQDGRPHRALLGDERQQLLRQHRRHVRATVGGDLAAQQPDDRVPARIGRRLAYSQAVQERQQRQRLAQLIAGAPEHLTAGLRRLGHGRPHQRGLADARLALDEHRTAVSPSDLFYEPRQQRHVAFAADQRTGRGNRVHAANFTT